MRLIDADAMNKELFYEQCGGKDSLITVEKAFEMIESQPTVDILGEVLEKAKSIKEQFKTFYFGDLVDIIKEMQKSAKQ